MIRDNLSVEPFRHEWSDNEWNVVELRGLSKLVDQLDASLFDIYSFSIEVEVLVGLLHLIIQKQHQEPWIKAFNFVISFHRLTCKWSQLSQNLLPNDFTKINSMIESNTYSKYLQYVGYVVKIPPVSGREHL